MKILVVTANDKLGRAMLEQLSRRPGLVTAFDVSPTLPRLIRLIRRGTLSPLLIARMAWAEFRRPPARAEARYRITGNRELLNLIQREDIDRVLLFRAGLIVGRDVLASNADILNIHCAHVPEYGGLGSIQRALNDHAWEQVACLHRVTDRIDDGEVIAREPYRLASIRSYRGNEDEAYAAGVRLLLRNLADGIE